MEDCRHFIGGVSALRWKIDRRRRLAQALYKGRASIPPKLLQQTPHAFAAQLRGERSTLLVVRNLLAVVLSLGYDFAVAASSFRDLLRGLCWHR
mmetsp:Transcript_74157/g.199963  ORF Transcript_74157/g.199963 Transcript_74157/m.199963 type:complete len:94 (-) Transcript_74157:225-506(-)